MITDVYIVYNDDKQREMIEGDTFKVSPFFHFIDSRTRNGRKESFKLKGSWSARLDPFAICYEGDKAIKAFYSEADPNVIVSLINYLNE